ncbi:hypothetical protein FQN55_005879 [Onygenales sp. PD_40]|nr:hypothetical protein FQN55_005879 [Onygenales sp. PD_40]
MEHLTLEGACERYSAVIRNSFWDKLLDKCLGSALANRLHIARLEKAHEISAKVYEEATRPSSSYAPSINESLDTLDEIIGRRKRPIYATPDEEWDGFFTELEENGSLNERASDDEDEDSDLEEGEERPRIRHRPSIRPYQPVGGIGKYQRFKDAPTAWVEENILRNLSFMAPFAKANVDKLGGYPHWHVLYENPHSDRLLDSEFDNRNGFIQGNGENVQSTGFYHSNTARSALAELFCGGDTIRCVGKSRTSSDGDSCIAGPSDFSRYERRVIFPDDGEDCAVESCDPLSTIDEMSLQGEDLDINEQQGLELKGKGKQLDIPENHDEIQALFGETTQYIPPQNLQGTFTDPRKHLAVDERISLQLYPWSAHWKLRLLLGKEDSFPPSAESMLARYEYAFRRNHAGKAKKSKKSKSKAKGCQKEPIPKKVPINWVTPMAKIKIQADIPPSPSPEMPSSTATTPDPLPLQLTCTKTNPFDHLARRPGLRPASIVLHPVLKPLLPHTTLPEHMEEAREMIARGLTALHSYLNGKASTPQISTFRLQSRNARRKRVKMYNREVLGLTALTSCQGPSVQGDWPGFYKKRDEDDALRARGLLYEDPFEEEPETDSDDELPTHLQTEKRVVKPWPNPPLYADYYGNKTDLPATQYIPDDLCEVLDIVDPLKPVKVEEGDAGTTSKPIRVRGAEGKLNLEYYFFLPGRDMIRELLKRKEEGFVYWMLSKKELEEF